MTIPRLAVRAFPLMVLWLFLVASLAGAEETVAGRPAAEALRLGEAMYQRGILPSGKPMRALVQGDLELSGTMTTCANCHMRSGLGSAEGGIFTPPTSGKKLYAPLTGQQDIPGPTMSRSMFQNPPRPAYDDASLLRALVYGVDPTGRSFSATMPRYLLEPDEAQILLYYIKQLSSTTSPGITDTRMHLATIVSDGVDAKAWEAQLAPLQAFFDKEWNARLAILGSQWNARWFGPGGKPGGGLTYREVAFEVWRLTGKPETWEAQLAEYYRRQPVFAVVGGSVSGSWSPVHRFCEKGKIPCLFPATELPQVAEQDLYTLYFSKGYFQEGEAAAKYLSRVVELPPGREVVQVFRDNEAGRALSRGFAETWSKFGKNLLRDVKLEATRSTGKAFWEELAARHPGAVLLVWLPAEDLAGVELLAQGPQRPSTLFFSSTLIEDRLTAVPEPLRDFSFLTWPKRLPGDGDYTRQLVRGWLGNKKLPVTDLAASAQSYFITRMLSVALIDMGTDYYRDFFLDLLDCSPDQVNSSLRYPVLSFGPGQRYASKGCYIVAVGKGAQPKLVKKSDWVIY
ncbi:cytochrome c [Geomonas limicola]|uniref:Cytochrome c n=1 Tax=Geomonas limicola TaxID=2740186 RepID=A0A6V8NCC9_9BACT|nr:ABC transporter substrate-binding protein [Geomonas limicola]GFO68819.1 cytochrome c [Geomonas limicola]